MHHREIEVLGPIGSVVPATVAPTLLLVILASFYVYGLPFGHQCEIADRREIGYAQKHGPGLFKNAFLVGIAGPDDTPLGILDEFEDRVTLLALGETGLNLCTTVGDVVSGVVDSVVDVLYVPDHF